MCVCWGGAARVDLQAIYAGHPANTNRAIGWGVLSRADALLAIGWGLLSRAGALRAIGCASN
jgi:hypothetical protein